MPSLEESSCSPGIVGAVNALSDVKDCFLESGFFMVTTMREQAPAVFLSLSKFPSNAICPLLSRIIRCAISSRSSMSWLVTTMVVPHSRLISFKKCIICCLASTSRPRVGSSRNMTEGSCSSSIPMSARIRWPRLSSLAKVRRMSSRSSSSVTRERFFLYISSGMPHTSFFHSKLVMMG